MRVARRRARGVARDASLAPWLIASLPNRPAGLISSTITMMTKITVFDASG